MILKLWMKDGEHRKTIIFVTHDVDEAMLLANRIFVFGAGVGHVVYDLKFGEDKPPHEKMFEDPEMIELRNTLMRMLHSNIDL